MIFLSSDPTGLYCLLLHFKNARLDDGDTIGNCSLVSSCTFQPSFCPSSVLNYILASVFSTVCVFCSFPISVFRGMRAGMLGDMKAIKQLAFELEKNM